MVPPKLRRNRRRFNPLTRETPPLIAEELGDGALFGDTGALSAVITHGAPSLTVPVQIISRHRLSKFLLLMFIIFRP